MDVKTPHRVARRLRQGGAAHGHIRPVDNLAGLVGGFNYSADFGYEWYEWKRPSGGTSFSRKIVTSEVKPLVETEKKREMAPSSFASNAERLILPAKEGDVQAVQALIQG